MKKLPLLLAIVGLLFGAFTHAETVTKPSSEAAKAVMDYYRSGTEGPVLVEFKICKEVATKGDEKNNCVDEVPLSAIELNINYQLWFNFLVPENTKELILVQFDHQGFTRSTAKMEVSGSFRYRTWTNMRLTRTGSWEIGVFADDGINIRKIHTVMLEPVVTP